MLLVFGSCCLLLEPFGRLHYIISSGKEVTFSLQFVFPLVCPSHLSTCKTSPSQFRFQLIEMRAEQKKAERESQHIKERSLLDQSPINWSHTLH